MRNSKDSLYLFGIESKKEKPNKAKLMRLASDYAKDKPDEKRLKVMASLISDKEEKNDSSGSSLKELSSLFDKNKREIKSENRMSEKVNIFLSKVKKNFPRYASVISEEDLKSRVKEIALASDRKHGEDYGRETLIYKDGTEKTISLKRVYENEDIERLSRELRNDFREEAEDKRAMKEARGVMKSILGKMMKKEETNEEENNYQEVKVKENGEYE